MNIRFPIEEAVKKRVSVRNYSDRPIEPDKKLVIQNFISNTSNPFNAKVNFHYFELNEEVKDQKLGTYGVIRNATHFLGASIVNVPYALEALGYEMETVMLYLASMDIGTCWLGGTFDRKGFARALNISEQEFLPAITPVGYAQPNRHIQEIVMRTFVQAHNRMDWNKLFFLNDFDTPLTKQEAKDFAFALEMVRLGPSASNKQPWRILWKDGNFHFCEYKTPGYSNVFPYDIQRIDMGIAAAHFDLACKEKGITGKFVFDQTPDIPLPQHTEYVCSWIHQAL